MAKLSPDRLPKGTTRELVLLQQRLYVLSRADVYVSLSQTKALMRVVKYLAAHDVEGAKS